MTFVSRLFAIALFTTALTGTAFATPIVGDVSIFGYTQHDDITDELTFDPAFLFQGTGSFASLAPFSAVTVGTINTATKDADPWTIGGFTFTPDLVYVSANGNFWDVIMYGWLTAATYDDTRYGFSLSTNPGYGTDVFSAINVPEPGTVALLGAGAFGLLLIRRRRTG